MEPLFSDMEEWQRFKARHDQEKAIRGNLAEFEGDCFLGIDAGSTTTKAALIDNEGRILYSYYANNEGSPLNSTIKLLQDLYQQLPGGAKIMNSTVTGYGEALIKSAFGVDLGEVETSSFGRQIFSPGVGFILDIGGQDMKCLKIKMVLLTVLY